MVKELKKHESYKCQEQVQYSSNQITIGAAANVGTEQIHGAVFGHKANNKSACVNASDQANKA